MICPQCQKEVPDDVKACGYCGYWLADSPEHSEEKRVDPPPQSKNLPWLWPVLGTVVVAAIVGAVVMLAGSGSDPDSQGENAPAAATVNVEGTVAAAVATFLMIKQPFAAWMKTEILNIQWKLRLQEGRRRTYYGLQLHRQPV
jgi:hypothetical protein